MANPGQNPALAREIREEMRASQQKNSAEWRECARKELAALPSGEFTGEEIRHIISSEIGDPAHPNAWGSLVLFGLQNGFLVDTGTWRRMKDSTSHGRKTTVYRTA